MINGAHVILYSTDAEADRAFFRDVLGFAHVDAGAGWLIFALPPAEVAMHPAAQNGAHELFLMCDDLQAQLGALQKKGVKIHALEEARWGSIVRLSLPGGGQIGLYQPKHETALSLR